MNLAWFLIGLALLTEGKNAIGLRLQEIRGMAPKSKKILKRDI